MLVKLVFTTQKWWASLPFSWHVHVDTWVLTCYVTVSFSAAMHKRHFFLSDLMLLQVRTVRVEKRINEIVNRLNRTKVERKPDFKGTTMIFVSAQVSI